MEKTARVSTLPKIKKPIAAFVPGAVARVATVVGRGGDRQVQQLEYLIRYRDGAGTQYEERLTQEYYI
jgi:hypothetical protein